MRSQPLGHDGAMDAEAVSLLREALDSTEWPDRARALGRAMRTTRTPGGLLIAGTPDEEPWHLTAHLADEARLSGLSQLTPTLLRWSPDLSAPPHLRVGVDRLLEARPGRDPGGRVGDRGPDPRSWNASATPARPARPSWPSTAATRNWPPWPTTPSRSPA